MSINGILKDRLDDEYNTLEFLFESYKHLPFSQFISRVSRKTPFKHILVTLYNNRTQNLSDLWADNLDYIKEYTRRL
jgi:hypothetical protein